jgi:hypothetical protein
MTTGAARVMFVAPLFPKGGFYRYPFLPPLCRGLFFQAATSRNVFKRDRRCWGSAPRAIRGSFTRRPLQTTAQCHSMPKNSRSFLSCGILMPCSTTSLRSPTTITVEDGPPSIGRCSLLVSPEVNVVGTLITPDKVGCVPVSTENAPRARLLRTGYSDGANTMSIDERPNIAKVRTSVMTRVMADCLPKC